MKKIFISILIIISVLLIVDFFSIVALNYSYVVFISIIIFAGFLIYKLIEFLFFKQPIELAIEENIKKEKPIVKKIKKVNNIELKKKNYIQQLKQTKEEKKVQDLEKWRAHKKKEKEQNRDEIALAYTLKIKREEERRLIKIKQKEDKIKLRKLEKERLIKEEEKNNLENIKNTTKEKNEKQDEKLSWFEQQEKKLKSRQLETENFSNNLDRLKGLAKNGKHQITELKRAEDKPKKENKVVKKSTSKKVIQPVENTIKTSKNKELEQLNTLKEKSVSKKVIKTVKPVVKKKPLTEKATNSSSTTKRVNYSTDNVITSTTQYPVIRKPQQKSIIRSFRLGRNNRKGYKEEAFYDAIKKHFYNDFNVLDNAMVAIGEGTNPYEPDIAMISKGKKNIYIDIEIDEPYAGVSRKLTHCYPEDINRDNYFVDRGWFVIRFSEYQVHHQIEECLREIVKVIAAIHISFTTGNISSFKSIDKINCWSTAQAQLWETQNYRENYLNHTFKPYSEPKRIIDTALTLEEKLEEYLVKPQTHNPIKKPTKSNIHPKVNNYIEREKVKAIIPPPKKEYNSSNSKVSDLIEMAISKGYAIEMEYTNYNGDSSIRKISKLENTQEFLEYGYGNTEHFKGYCHNRESERSFRVSRINYMKVLN
ncbi:hypothetical protein [uncultured Polaribacter sp.]|uniref:hypothetical protein n=1 Tax=uncultured Polaribacter sp. TaxID=174711 RepID=UPI002632368E|nr:hypothetical protein [uncultured Polaribacter sp.]